MTIIFCCSLSPSTFYSSQIPISPAQLTTLFCRTLKQLFRKRSHTRQGISSLRGKETSFCRNDTQKRFANLSGRQQVWELQMEGTAEAERGETYFDARNLGIVTFLHLFPPLTLPRQDAGLSIACLYLFSTASSSIGFLPPHSSHHPTFLVSPCL